MIVTDRVKRDVWHGHDGLHSRVPKIDNYQETK
jgi:hypothetical protein